MRLRRLSSFLSLLGLAMLPAAVQADQAAAAACAAKLSKEGQMLYEKAAPTVSPSNNIKDALTAVARPLVMNGAMSRAVARDAAEAAGECMKLAN
ncbi:MAG: hypothetical protein PSV46_22235 [Reyranella sp.]|nr:hypothetical protein [Reyranella sp.]